MNLALNSRTLFGTYNTRNKATDNNKKTCDVNSNNATYFIIVLHRPHLVSKFCIELMYHKKKSRSASTITVRGTKAKISRRNWKVFLTYKTEASVTSVLSGDFQGDRLKTLSIDWNIGGTMHQICHVQVEEFCQPGHDCYGHFYRDFKTIIVLAAIIAPQSFMILVILVILACKRKKKLIKNN